MTIAADRVVATDVLSLVAQISPEAWRVITAPEAARSASEVVELQPQPLPPAEHFHIAAASMAREFVRIALESEIQGRPAIKIISDMVDEWCLTWPRNWPHPRPVPSPEPGPRPNEGPIPDPWLAQTGRIIGAVVLASVGSRLGNEELRNALLTGAQRLSDAALSR
jgi:hypothetical protein